MKEVKFFKANKNAIIPSPATKMSAGMDLHAAEEATIQPQSWGIVKTGLKMQLPEGTEAQVRSRSGLAAKQGVFVLNSPGTIDADYRGEVGVILANYSTQPFEVKVGDRIAQMVIANYLSCTVNEVVSEDEFSKTERGAGGFGSTGVQ